MSSSDGPTFLSAPPTTVPEPASSREVVLQAPPPYRSPGVVSAPRRVPTASPAPASAAARDLPAAILVGAEPIGDAAGQHLTIDRGRYGAWAYVVLAFVAEAVLIASVPYYVLRAVLGSGNTASSVAILGNSTIGLLGAWVVFHDRWRCIEASASRFCSGLMNLSILYVPVVALMDANARGLAKLTRPRG